MQFTFESTRISIRHLHKMAQVEAYRITEVTCTILKATINLFKVLVNMPSHIMLSYGLIARRKDCLLWNHSLQARQRRNARRKATFMVFTTLLQVAVSYLYGRRVRSVRMLVR